MSKRKILVLATALCMVAILAVGGTLAYFTDSDYDKNVMIVGNLDIDQVEDWDEAGILAPGDVAIKKNVHVENNGTVPAYVRVLIAFEDTRDVSSGVHVVSGQNEHLTFPQQGQDWLQIQDANGTIYTVGVVNYPYAIEPGKSLPFALTSIQLKAEVDNAWREIVGDNYNVLVLTQAANATDTATAKEILDIAFGEIDYSKDTEVAQWFTEISGESFYRFDYSWYAQAGVPVWEPDFTTSVYESDLYK